MHQNKICSIGLAMIIAIVAGCESPHPKKEQQTPSVSNNLHGAWVPFTTALREEFQLTSEDMTHLQFCVSSQIKLVRNLSPGDNRAVAGGKLRLSGENVTEEVLIPMGTMCAVRNATTNRAFVSFNQDFPKCLLGFGDSGTSDGKYVLGAKWWQGSGWGAIGYLDYGDGEFRAVDNSSAAFLFVVREGLIKFGNRLRIEPGVRVPEFHE